MSIPTSTSTAIPPREATIRARLRRAGLAGPRRSRSWSTWPSPSTSATRSTWSWPGRCSRASSGQFPRRRRTPESIGYRPAPIRVPLDPLGDPPAGGLRRRRRAPRAELTLFDFGAISLAVQFPLEATPAALLQLAGRLAEPAPLNEAARGLLAPWIERLRPAVYDFAVSSMSEEYIVFQLGERRTDWLEKHADWIAGLVRLEVEPLSRDEVARGDPAGASRTRPTTSSCSTGRPDSSPTPTAPTPSRSSSSPTSSSSSSGTSTTGSTTASRPPTG